MIKEAIQYLTELGKTEKIEVHGHMFSNKEIHRVLEPTLNEPFNLTTLTGVIDYVKNNTDIAVVGDKLTIHVNSPSKVTIYSALNDDRVREPLVIAKAVLPEIPIINSVRNFNNFYEVEWFNVALQSCFEKNDDLNAILSLIGNIKEENVKNSSDDGVSQTVTAKVGIARVEEVTVPNPVTLIPYRTFPEINQPESKFVFRLKDGPRATLFEAGGTGWRQIAMQDIKGYLVENLEDHDVNIIL